MDARYGETFEGVNPYTGKVWSIASEAEPFSINAYKALYFTTLFGGNKMSGLGLENGSNPSSSTRR